MEEQTLLSTSPEHAELKEKMVVTDVELCCAVILNFYRNHGKNWLTADEIFSFLDIHYVTTKEKVTGMLEILHKQYLGSKVTTGDIDNPISTKYSWTIRSEKDRLYHSVNLCE